MLYTTANETSGVSKELDQLLSKQQAVVADAMDRYIRSAHLPKEVRSLRNGIFELRVRAECCAIRLHFANTSDSSGRVALALLVVNKKTQQARNQDIEKSLKRLSDWEERHRPR